MNCSKATSLSDYTNAPKDRRLFSGTICISLLFLIFCFLRNNQLATEINNAISNRSRSLQALDPRTVEAKERIVEVNNPVTDPRKIQQIQNFRNKAGLIVSVHITHHSGTSLCFAMRKLLPVPSFACMSDKQYWPRDAYTSASTRTRRTYPWNNEETNHMVESIRPTFRYISWEFGRWGNIHPTDWENERLVSMIVMRDPLERFLAGGKCGKYHEILPRDPTPTNQHLYWDYANSQCALNFAMRVLTAKEYDWIGEGQGEEQLEEAKTLLKRFTFIIDQACLTDSITATGRELDLKLDRNAIEKTHKHHDTLRQRFGNDTLYEYVKHRFRYDIALYEWAKTQSIVQCNNLTVSTTV